MKITQNTPDTLVINCRERGGAVFFGLLFLGALSILFLLPGQGAPVWVWLMVGFWPTILGLVTIMAPRRSQMVLDRARGRLELRRRHVQGYHSHWFDLANVDLFYPSQRFDVESATGSSTRSGFLNVRVSQGMDPGNYSLNTYATSLLRIRAISDAANAWLAK